MNLITRRLARGEGEAFSGMTFPAYRHLMGLSEAPRLPNEAATSVVQPVAVLAIADGAPAGLALADLPVSEGGQHPQLLSVFVPPAHRGRGVARRLIESIEEEVLRAGFDRIETTYTTGKEPVRWIELLLDSRGWSDPVTRMVSVKLDVARARTAPWLARQRLRPGWEIFEWSSLTSEEYEALRESNRQERWIAPDLEPWKHDVLGFEPVSSLGLKRDGQIVGWNITHVISSDTLRFTCSFIRKPLGRMGKILPLYSESFRRMEGAGFTTATLTAPLHHGGMARFSKKWIGPWASFIGETRGRHKILALESEQS